MTETVRAQEQKIDRLAEINQKLEQALEDIFDPERYKRFLETMSRFHRYSPRNQLLIAAQNPDASLVAGYKTWQGLERQVKKGEKALWIVAPMSQKKTVLMDKIENCRIVRDERGNPVQHEVERDIPFFRAVPVFDVSQTEGKDLDLDRFQVRALHGEVEDFDALINIVQQASSVPISFEDFRNTSHQEMMGYFDRRQNLIFIREDISQLETLSTIIHEMAHATMHRMGADKPKPNEQRELEAESVAFVVCSYLGLDTSDHSFGYITNLTHGRDKEMMQESLAAIRQAAHGIIDKLDAPLQNLEKQRTEREAEHVEQQEMASTPVPEASKAVSEITSEDDPISTPIASSEIPLNTEPQVTIRFSDHPLLNDGEVMSLFDADRRFAELDKEVSAVAGKHAMTDFRIEFMLNGKPETYDGRQVIGDGTGGIIQHIEHYASFHRHDEGYQQSLAAKGTEAMSTENAALDAILTTVVPYLQKHCRLTELEQKIQTWMDRLQSSNQEQDTNASLLDETLTYCQSTMQYISDRRIELNTGAEGIAMEPAAPASVQAAKDEVERIHQQTEQFIADIERRVALIDENERTGSPESLVMGEKGSEDTGRPLQGEEPSERQRKPSMRTQLDEARQKALEMTESSQRTRQRAKGAELS